MLQKDISDNKAIGDFGAAAILKQVTSENVRILTHCNTGSLATAGYGTALGVIRSLYSSKKIGKWKISYIPHQFQIKHTFIVFEDHVYCTETRPYNQGARLTAYELVHEKIPSTLIVDSMVAALMKARNITAVIVGADRVRYIISIAPEYSFISTISSDNLWWHFKYFSRQ